MDMLDTDLDLRDVCVGDLGGVLLFEDLEKNSKDELLERFNRHWLGIQRKHLETCARRAASSKEEDIDVIGTVCFAVGPERAKSALVAVRQNLVSHLVIDFTCAKRIGELVSELEKTNGPHFNKKSIEVDRA